MASEDAGGEGIGLDSIVGVRGIGRVTNRATAGDEGLADRRDHSEPWDNGVDQVELRGPRPLLATFGDEHPVPVNQRPGQLARPPGQRPGPHGGVR